ncbi:MAG: C-type lectin domain-containing protein [Dolichospermum sp.]
MFIYNGSTYLLTNFGTWEQAQAEAQSLGGNLVTINTALEQTFLVNTFGGSQELWIGYTDKVTEGQFKWVSNETSTYTNWFPGQPDNGGSGRCNFNDALEEFKAIGVIFPFTSRPEIHNYIIFSLWSKIICLSG